ncbi:bifunctional 2-polyprenyl-6-hydroxyphenol methylase/3-demethylubiquinol 3-O-methyltransferase UbiG [Methylobacter sp. S3L5C]|uniref:class I SAM-dependent methyltransferase n=1 Tax=Methylobacter sp. S3L5C TaxID=2839024 RepID=UPI001FACF1A9|nr:class I SAM-dependent methyltransferase [Methylobacter sp. S3L5C]UOA09521.1 class I SAM-dependent methyltransferase [Methylobacter sp. S3L5C]
MADLNFYRAFEERHRGSQELIKSRLEIYLPFILPLKQFDISCQGIDLGCGRGEWLELMQENGIDVRGVDLDQGMLDAARRRGLNVSQGDAIETLKSVASESQMLVSAFHLAEHLPFDLLQTLINESLRILKPGGLLILETPNPENIVVGTASFYLDPTHQRPIPLQLLSFIAEYSGFAKVKVLRLQEPIGIADNNELTLMNVLNDVSQDYAVVAQKGNAPKVIAATVKAFKANYGLSLESIANSYDQQIKTKIYQAEVKARQAENKAHQAEVALIAINNSLSWRLTEPLRMLGRTAKSLFRFPKVAKLKSKEKIKLLLTHIKLYVSQRSKLRRMVFVVLAKFPALEGYIRRATRNASSRRNAFPPVAAELAGLTPRARLIYADLKAARQNHNKENF